MKPIAFHMKPARRLPGMVYRWLSGLFFLAGFYAVAYVGYMYGSAYAFQKIEEISFNSSRTPDVPETPNAPAIEHIVPDGGVIGRLEIARLGLSAIVVEGDTPSLLAKAVGHVPQTAMPGEIGNVALTGHRDTFFRALREIQEGDIMTLETTAGEYHYAVQSTAVVLPTETGVLQSSDEEELTLITCYPFYFVGPAPNRFIVRAYRIKVSP
jgi:sortase A